VFKSFNVTICDIVSLKLKSMLMIYYLGQIAHPLSTKLVKTNQSTHGNMNLHEFDFIINQAIMNNVCITLWLYHH
jgi:hypothetical protein